MSGRWSAEELEFPEAVEWFSKRVRVTPDTWSAMDAKARQRAFVVAGVARLDLLHDVHRSLQEALQRGETFEAWKAKMGPALEKEWAGTVKDPARRLETIFRTNIQQAYSAGRQRQLRDPAVLKYRPFWLFDAIMDNATTRMCHSANGTLLPHDDPWWATHTPPLHFNCRSGIRSLRAKQAERRGGPSRPEKDHPAQKGFGLPADLGEEWQPKLEKYDAEFKRTLEQRLASGPGDPVPQLATTRKPPPGKEPPWKMTPEPTGGSIDENRAENRAFAPKEREIALYLARQGNRVFKRPENSQQKGRLADVELNGARAELKTPTAKGIDGWARAITSSVSGGGQARAIVLDMRKLSINLLLAQKMLYVFRRRYRVHHAGTAVDWVRIIAKDFDLTSYEGNE